MSNIRRVCAATLLSGSMFVLGWLPRTSAQDQQEPLPAFHEKAPNGPLPPTVDPAQFPEPLVQNAYATAARVKKTIYQEPCYCHCDRSQGHGSLQDCFVSRHGSGCNICMSEVFYTSEQLKKGKTAAQIREGIIKGEWQNVALSKYNQAPAAKASR